MGDSIATNLFMLGYAFQKGLMPLSLAAIERAIELNGVAVEANKHAFAWGRLAAHGPCRSSSVPAAGASRRSAAAAGPRRARRAPRGFLADYQDEAYAQRYRDFVAAVAEAEKARVARPRPSWPRRSRAASSS